MQVGNRLQFKCIACEKAVGFSVLNLGETDPAVACEHCRKRYQFSEKTLLRDLRNFESLCRQIHASKDILGNTGVAIDVGPHHVEVPFKLLLTRFSSIMNLKLGEDNIQIAFRFEPIHDIAAAELVTG